MDAAEGVPEARIEGDQKKEEKLGNQQHNRVNQAKRKKGGQKKEKRKRKKSCKSFSQNTSGIFIQLKFTKDEFGKRPSLL